MIRLLTLQAVERLRQRRVAIDPLAAATSALRTGPEWFDDVDPATQFALLWIEHASPDKAVSVVLADAARVGYRIGRLYLGDAERPILGMPSFADTFADALFRACVGIDQATFFDALPEDMTISNIVAAQSLAARWGSQFEKDREESLGSICVFGVDTGTALALAEQQLSEL